MLFADVAVPLHSLIRGSHAVRLLRLSCPNRGCTRCPHSKFLLLLRLTDPCDPATLVMAGCTQGNGIALAATMLSLLLAAERERGRDCFSLFALTAPDRSVGVAACSSSYDCTTELRLQTDLMPCACLPSQVRQQHLRREIEKQFAYHFMVITEILSERERERHQVSEQTRQRRHVCMAKQDNIIFEERDMNGVCQGI